MKIEFKNDIGSIVFSGGRSFGRNTCYIVEVTGLGLAPANFTSVVFSGTDGAKTTSKRLSARTIILSADVPRRSYDFDDFYGKFLRVLSAEGKLFISSKKKKRCIGAYAASLSEGASQGEYKRIVITFTCDSPYFTDFSEVSVPLFTKNRYLETTFTLPCVFSERINRVTVHNSGDVPAEPVIRFTNAVGGYDGVDGNLVITNETTGQVLVLDYYPSPGEAVIIDIENRTIFSSGGANLINFISDDSDLSLFWLCVGENTLSVESNITNNKVHVECSFNNRYIEGAVYGY